MSKTNSEEMTKIKRVCKDILNTTYPGLTMYVRDINLPDDLASKYVAGKIIREKGYADSSNRVMGMITSHRYAILSNHMNDMSKVEITGNAGLEMYIGSPKKAVAWGLHIAKRDSHFKILANYTYFDKSMILLLHLPDDDRWKFFINISSEIDSQLIESSIERFKSKCHKSPIPELISKQWLERCSFPVGMSENGVFFEL